MRDVAISDPMTALPATSRPRAPQVSDAWNQARIDPLVPTAADGWSPSKTTAVVSRNTQGFYGSAVRFTFGGIEELPGQRLSVGQVDALAPFYATQYGLDEGYVRQELAKVYIYVGGPSTTAGQAMTVGHHIYVPDAESLTRITTPAGKRWLTHELAHTMQFLAYHDASPQRFMADYFTSMVVGRDPGRPGQGGGPFVWGALFTGLRTAGGTQADLGKGAVNTRQRLGFSVLPGAVIGVPVALAASGALAAARAKTGVPGIMGSMRSVPTALGVIAAPMLLGASFGTFSDKIGSGTSQALGAAAGGVAAGATMWRAGAFTAGIGGHTPLGRAIGFKAGLAIAIGGVVGGAALGWLTARTSANSIRGWSSSAEVLNDLHRQDDSIDTERLTFQNALHDSHWLELDAEAVAQTYVRGGWHQPTDGKPVAGRTPDGGRGATLGDKIDADLSDRADWGLKVPLLLGLPAAAAVGAGVLSFRTGHTLLDSTLREGKGPLTAIRDAIGVLGSRQRGVGNSLGVGAAVTLTPLMVGGLVGPVAYNVTGSGLAARAAGAGASAVVTGALLALLLKGNGAGAMSVGLKSFAGMAVAAGVGLLSAGVATDALRPHVREYDTSWGEHATDISGRIRTAVPGAVPASSVGG